MANRPSPEQWWGGLDALERIEFVQAAHAGRLTENQYENLLAAGITTWAWQFDGHPAELVWPLPYLRHVLNQAARVPAPKSPPGSP
jgi:hypothetical protein